MFLTVVFTNSALFFFGLQPMMHLTVENTVQEYEKKVYIHFKFEVRKLEIRPVPFLFFKPTLIHSRLKANLFNIQCLICYTWVVRRCATSIEAEGIQRPHANTSQVISFFFFCFFFLNSIVLFHSGYSVSKGAPARVSSRSMVLMTAAEEQTWGLLAQSRNLVQCPGDLTMQELSFTGGLQPQAEITVDQLVFS